MCIRDSLNPLPKGEGATPGPFPKGEVARPVSKDESLDDYIARVERDLKQ